MKHLIRFLLLAISLAFLTACGGDSASKTPLSHKELYEQIQQGMTPVEVQALVGEAPLETYYSNGAVIAELYSRGTPKSAEWTSIGVSYDFLSQPSTGINGKAYVTVSETYYKDYTQ